MSAHPHGESIVAEGEYEGYSLSDLWENKRHLFGKYTDGTFPLLIKILDAADDLSVQVHPNDVQAQELEGVPYGKTECWYVVEAEEGAELIIDHTARLEDELSDHINNGEWDRLLTRQPVTKGDFIFVLSGTVHAIGKGIMILETQQSSDTTYRLYDFGHTRELHLDKAMTVTIILQEVIMSKVRSQKVEGRQIKRLVKVPEFNVYHVQATSGFELKANYYLEQGRKHRNARCQRW